MYLSSKSGNQLYGGTQTNQNMPNQNAPYKSNTEKNITPQNLNNQLEKRRSGAIANLAFNTEKKRRMNQNESGRLNNQLERRRSGAIANLYANTEKKRRIQQQEIDNDLRKKASNLTIWNKTPSQFNNNNSNLPSIFNNSSKAQPQSQAQ